MTPADLLLRLRDLKVRASVLDGRLHLEPAEAVPDDLKALAGPVLGHRVFLKGGDDARTLVEDVVTATPVEL